MGVSGKWLKSLINEKKSESPDYGKMNDKTKKKWRLWRSSLEGYGSSSKRGHAVGSEASDSDDAFSAAIATVVRAPPKYFMVIRQEWAAIRIQTAFRGLLARRALRALRAVVRLQAIFRGQQVRKQAAVTLRCMQALVRVQAQVRAKSARVSSEGQAVQKLLDEYGNKADPTKQAEQGWCDIPGKADEVRVKLQMKQEGAVKRERAIPYSLFQQQSNLCPSPNSRTNKLVKSVKHHKLNENSQGWSWLDSWMAAKPWDGRLLDEIHTNTSEVIPFSRKSDNIGGFCSGCAEHDSIKVRRNKITTKVLAKPPIVSQITRSLSSPSPDSPNSETSQSTSSSSLSLTPVSGNILMAMVDRPEESYYQKPSHMNLTEPTSKQKASRFCSYNNLMELSNGDVRRCAESDPSFNLCKDLHPPLPLG